MLELTVGDVVTIKASAAIAGGALAPARKTAKKASKRIMCIPPVATPWAAIGYTITFTMSRHKATEQP
jgi:hypothetical protein